MSGPGEESFDVSSAQLKPGTVAIVTGSAEGLGKAFAGALLHKGARGVCLSDVNETKGKETLQEFVKEFGKDRVIFVKCDVTLALDLEAAFVKTKDVFGAVNLMVNNAGIMNETNPQLCIDVNVKGTTVGTFTAIKYMGADKGGQGGKIINISSMAGLGPAPFMPVYAATKHAIVGLTRSLVADPHLQAQGITFGVLCPAFAKTRIIDGVEFRQDENKLQAEAAKKKFGISEISEVRDAFLQLVLDESWAGKVMTLSKASGISSA